MARRLQLHVSEDNYERISAYANEMGISLSGAVAVLTNQALEQREMMSRLPVMMDMVGQLEETAKAAGLQV